MKIELIGSIPSKKNSKQIIYVAGHPRIIPSKAHQAWHKSAIAALDGVAPIDGVLRIFIKLYFGDRRKADLTNKAESIMDLLVDAGIIEDDNYLIVPELNLIGEYRKGEPGAEITIERVTDGI